MSIHLFKNLFLIIFIVYLWFILTYVNKLQTEDFRQSSLKNILSVKMYLQLLKPGKIS